MTHTADHDSPAWDLAHLRTHLQSALDLELWTIPYYMATMYSIKDPASEAYQLIQSVVYQEMLHAQLVGNLTNAFGGVPHFTAPVYGGPTIPHLDFQMDEPNPTEFFAPYSTAIGPLDQERLNTLCLIEYPQWRTGHTPDVQEDRTQYGSIGEFYDALRVGITVLRQHLRPNVHQVDYFAAYYNRVPTMMITKSGLAGYYQAMNLLDIIVQQGEGQTQGDADIPLAYQNTADGYEDSWPHFRKFMRLRQARSLPATFATSTTPGAAGCRAQAILRRDFATFLATLNALFRGESPRGFGAFMAKLGGDVLSCWQHGAVPTFL